MIAIQGHTRVSRAEQQVSTVLDGETVVLDLGSGDYYALNEVGSHLWNLLAESTTVDQLARALVEEYEVELERAVTDVVAVLTELAGQGLVELAGADQPEL